jgi:hypothetical protein
VSQKVCDELPVLFNDSSLALKPEWKSVLVTIDPASTVPRILSLILVRSRGTDGNIVGCNLPISSTNPATSPLKKPTLAP